VAQEPVEGGADVRLDQRLELTEAQIAKLWQLFTEAARLNTTVESLSYEVRFAISMWQQIQDNGESLLATRDEVHAVQAAQRQKVDQRIVRRLMAAVGIAIAVLSAGVGWVWSEAQDVRRIAHEECAAANGRVQAAITRERALAETDLPDTRPAHRQSADAMSRQLRQCG
jgi:nitroreductase